MKDNSSSATKADIQAVMDSIGKLYDANARWKDEILDSMARGKHELRQHFDVTVENIRHDLEGANRDEISVLKDTKRDHEKRITRLEQRVGVSE